MEKLIHENLFLGIIFYESTSIQANSISFLTDNDSPLQLGIMNRPKNYVIRPHRHLLHERKIEKTFEVLFIKSGSIKINFFDDKEIFLFSKDVKKGDVVLLAEGGHGFEMNEDSEIIEVKQGPFIADRDKIKFS